MKNKNNLLVRILPVWLTIVFITTVLCGFFYVSVQQVLRISANDPQIQIAEDIVTTLDKANQLPTLSPVIDIKHSLATFVIIFDKQGRTVTSTAQLNGLIPNVPQGVFQYAQAHQENRLTWQPENGLRFAAVVVPYGNKSGYVLVGRSLREVEKRIDQLTLFTGLAWISSVIGSFIVLLLCKLIFL